MVDLRYIDDFYIIPGPKLKDLLKPIGIDNVSKQREQAEPVKDIPIPVDGWDMVTNGDFESVTHWEKG